MMNKYRAFYYFVKGVLKAETSILNTVKVIEEEMKRIEKL